MLVIRVFLCYIRGHETEGIFCGACLQAVPRRDPSAGPRRHGLPWAHRAEALSRSAGRAGKERDDRDRHGHQRQDHDLPYDRAVVGRRWNLLLCQQVRRKPAQRRDRRVRHALFSLRQVPLYARADRVGRGGVQGDFHVRRREGRRGDEPLPRPARPLRRGHAHAGKHQDRHQPQPERHALPERGRFALHVDARRF